MKKTLIVGTSKTKEYNGYYFCSLHFWDTINESDLNKKYNKEIGPCDYKDLEKVKVEFYDYIKQEDVSFSVSDDKEVKEHPNEIKTGVEKLITRVKNKKIKRIVFNGKTAVKLYKKYGGELPFTNTTKIEYGKTSNLINDIEIWVMPNTSPQARFYWKEDNGYDKWLNLWNTIAKENN